MVELKTRENGAGWQNLSLYIGTGCSRFDIKHLADIDPKVLELPINRSIRYMRSNYDTKQAAMDTVIKSSRLEGTTLVVDTDSGTETYDAQFLVAALLVFIARGTGTIEPEETAEMLQLIQSHFHLRGPESLELLTRAMSELAEKPGLGKLLTELGQTLQDSDKEDIAVMALKVIAADGRRQFAEMESFDLVVEAVGMSADVVHRAFDRYFAETMPGN